MRINQTKIVTINAKEIKLYTKVRDEFAAYIYDSEGIELGGQGNGYVPDFMPGDHDGDYIMLNIDLDSGVITNWKVPTADEIEYFILGDND